MKKLFAILAIAGIVTPCFSQFIPGPRLSKLVTNTDAQPFLLSAWSATTVTNIPGPAVVPLSGGPVALWIVMAATNATPANLSNISCQFQISANGTEWHGPLQDEQLARNLDIRVYGLGGARKAAYTNILTDAQASPWKYIRLYSLSNFANGGDWSNSYYITNIAISQR